MTLTLAAIDANRITVAWDTAMFQASGEFLDHMPKAHLLPHLDVVIGGRGKLTTMNDIATALTLQPLPDGLDSIAECGPETIEHIYYRDDGDLNDLVPGVADEGANADLLGMLEFFAFGWSRSRGQMMGFSFASYDDFEARQLPPGGILAAPLPPDGAPQMSTRPRDRDVMDGMRALYAHMAEWASTEGHDVEHCGGRVRVFDIKRDGITLRDIGALPNNARLNGDGADGDDNVVAMPAPGKHDPCPCGSGKKHMKCCKRASG